MKSRFTYITALLAATLLLSSCKKDEPTNTAPEATEAAMTLRLDADFDGSALAHDEEYTAGTTKFRLTNLAFYINSVELIRQDNTTYTLPGNPAFYVKLTDGAGGGGHAHKTQHGDLTHATLELGNVPKGSYKGIRFSIGHTMMTGHNGTGGSEGKVQPTDYADAHALGAKSPSMWWSWNTGYIFFKLDGVVDTNDNGTIDAVGTDDATDRNMNIHLGTSDMIQAITSYEEVAFTVGDGANTVGLRFDLNEFFHDINLREEFSTHSMGDGAALAARYRDNLNGVFHVANSDSH